MHIKKAKDLRSQTKKDFTRIVLNEGCTYSANIADVALAITTDVPPVEAAGLEVDELNAKLVCFEVLDMHPMGRFMVQSLILAVASTRCKCSIGTR